MKKRAFTLIELLVVIAIIGILATIIIVSYSNAQARSRDSKRTADVEALANAMQMYYVDNKEYPMIDPYVWSRVRSTNINDPQNRWDVKLQNKIKDYISIPIVVDPKNITAGSDSAIWSNSSSNNDYLYTYTASKIAYIIGAKMEVREGNGGTLGGKTWLNGCDVADDPGANPAAEKITTNSAKLSKLYIVGKNLK